MTAAWALTSINLALFVAFIGLALYGRRSHRRSRRARSRCCHSPGASMGRGQPATVLHLWPPVSVARGPGLSAAAVRWTSGRRGG